MLRNSLQAVRLMLLGGCERMLGQPVGAVLIASFDGQAELQARDETIKLLLIAPLA